MTKDHLKAHISREIDYFTSNIVKQSSELYNNDPTRLVDILLNIQSQIPQQYISRTTAEHVAQVLQIPLIRVFDVLSFYTALSQTPKAPVVIQCCDSVVCKVAGHTGIRDHLKNLLNLEPGQTDPTGRYYLEAISCFGACDIAPALRINGRVFGHLHTSDQVLEAINASHPNDSSLNDQTGPSGQSLANTENLLVSLISENFNRYKTDDFKGYMALGGLSALGKAFAISRSDLANLIKTSGLQGRGGAAYSTGVKWQQALSVKGENKVVICNADEGEPCTFKDREVIDKDPYRLIEGIVLCGYAVGANRGYIYLREEYAHLRKKLLKAIEDFRSAGLLGASPIVEGLKKCEAQIEIANHIEVANHIEAADFKFDIEVYSGAGAYVCGEGSTLIESMEGKSGRPRIKPPYIKECGLFLQPTCINNVETLAAAVAIVQHGVDAFTQHGVGKSTGTKLICIGGNVKNPGTYEIPFGITLRQILYDIGGGLLEGQSLQLIQLGGASGRVASPEMLDTPYTYEDFNRVGLDIGSGGFLVVDQRTSVLDFLRMIQDFFSHECCGKCTPCREGNYHISRMLDQLLETTDHSNQAKQSKSTKQLSKFECDEITFNMQHYAEIMSQCAFCGLGETAQSAFLSCLKLFPRAFTLQGLVEASQSKGADTLNPSEVHHA